MKHAWRTALIALVLLGRCDFAAIDADVGVVLRDKLLQKASVGIRIVQLSDSGRSRVLFEHDAPAPLVPASNMKVLTTSAALDYLGPSFRFRTLLAQRANDLVLIGDGDPAFGDHEFLKKSGWDTTTVFRNWARQLRKAKLTSFRNLLVDDSVFDQAFVHPHWDSKYLLYRYSAQIAGMTLNVGCVDFYLRPTSAGRPAAYVTNPPTHYITVINSCMSGGENAIVLHRELQDNTVHLRGTCPHATEVPVSIPVHDPALFAATVLLETLRAEGIRITGGISRDTSVRAALASGQGAGLTTLAVHETSLPQVLSRCNKDSVNLYAESLAKRLAFASTGKSGSWPAASATVGEFLKKIGADDRQFRVDDGCGLSRENRVSAAVIVRILEHNFTSNHRDVFLSSLAVAGEDGTLDNRFKSTDLRARVFAKTGYINGVSALSGYLKAKNGQWYAFSILMNNLPSGTNSRAKQLQESIVRAIDNNSAGRR